MSRSLLLKCAVLASFSLLAAACGDDDKAGDACDNSFVASCDGNATLTCVNSKIVKTDCRDKACKAGVCEDVVVVDACDATFKASCAGNVAQTCVDKKVVKTDCDDKVCTAGVCIAAQTETCDTTYKANCVGNAVQSCVDKKIVKKDCGAEVCENGVCVDLQIKECAAGYVASCKDNAALTCVENVITTTDCGAKVCEKGVCVDLQIEECAAGYVASCKGNAALTCVDNVITSTDCLEKSCVLGACVAIPDPPKEGEACTTSLCIGNDVYRCFSKKYKKGESCASDTVCSVDAVVEGFGSCLTACTEAKKGDSRKVCDEIAGAQYVVTYVCDMDALGNYVYDDDIDNTPYVKCDGACSAGVCLAPPAPKTGEACTKGACDGKDMYNCYSKKYSKVETCVSDSICSVDKDGYGSCVNACTEAQKGDSRKVCDEIAGAQYVVTYVCDIDALGNYVYDDDIDNTPYVKCASACIDGVCNI